MSLLSWFAPRPRRPAAARRPSLEALEDRCVPAAVIAYSVLSGAGGNDALFRFDLTVNSRQQIGTGVGFTGVSGLAFDPTTRLLDGVDETTDRLVVINPQNGFGFTGTLGFLGAGLDVSGVGLAFSPGGTLFMADSGTQTLYTIDTSTGLATPIGALNLGAAGVTGLAFRPDGVLFGITDEGANARLVTINTSTGAATPLGPLGLGSLTSGGIDFTNDGTTLYGIDADTGEIFTVNTSTGQATVTVDTMQPGFEGLAVEPPPVPVPSPPPPTPIGPLPTLSVGTNPNTQAFVKIYGPDLNERFIVNPFPGYNGAIRAVAGDVNGDRATDSIVGVSDGGQGHVKVIDGFTGAEIASFFAFDVGYTGGVNVGAGDVNGDGFDDVIVGTASQFSHVKVFDVHNGGAVLASFIAFDGYAGGVTVGGGDLNGDRFADVVVGTAREASHVKAFDVHNGGALLASFIAPGGAFPTLGVEVTAADLDGDGKAEIIAAVSGPAVIDVFDPTTLALLNAVTPFPGYNSRLGVDGLDFNGDGRDDLLITTLSGPVLGLISEPANGSLIGPFIAFPSARDPVPR